MIVRVMIIIGLLVLLVQADEVDYAQKTDSLANILRILRDGRTKVTDPIIDTALIKYVDIERELRGYDSMANTKIISKNYAADFIKKNNKKMFFDIGVGYAPGMDGSYKAGAINGFASGVRFNSGLKFFFSKYLGCELHLNTSPFGKSEYYSDGIGGSVEASITTRSLSFNIGPVLKIGNKNFCYAAFSPGLYWVGLTEIYRSDFIMDIFDTLETRTKKFEAGLGYKASLGYSHEISKNHRIAVQIFMNRATVGLIEEVYSGQPSGNRIEYELKDAGIADNDISDGKVVIIGIPEESFGDFGLSVCYVRTLF